MPASSGPVIDVLIAGAGPTGLVLALWLTQLGVRVRIIDKSAEPAATSRALAVQARTLEFYDQVGLAEAVVQRGRPMVAVNLWVTGRNVARAAFGDMGEGISPYPYALVFSQDEHERLLAGRLRELGVEIERQTELLEIEETGSGVRARLKRSDGALETGEAAYVAGCAGARSAVREALGIGFPGGTYAHLFYVADVDAAGPAANGEIHVAFDKSDFLAVFPLKQEKRVRLVGTIRQEAEHQLDNLNWQDVSKRVIDWMRIDVARVNWFSTYRVHHRVANRFRGGRVFLAGDAAHIHSPVGGQGMNTGIGDAVNLAWKLAAVLHGEAEPGILDTYETERIAFARRLVATTDRAFSGVTASGAIARTLRLRIVPLLIPLLFSFHDLRRFMFRMVSQTAINYRDSALSKGTAGEIHGGDRLPWVKTISGGDNFAPLSSLRWQAHVYGNPTPAIRSACKEMELPLHEFEWQSGMRRNGLERDALYLVRPDGYVGLAIGSGSGAAELQTYVERHKLTFNRL